MAIKGRGTSYALVRSWITCPCFLFLVVRGEYLRRGSRDEHRAARRIEKPGRVVHLKARAKKQKSTASSTGRAGTSGEKAKFAALEVRRLRRPGACASRQPKCSSDSIAVRNNSLRVARCTMPWLLRCRWGLLLCACTISFQVAVVESQLRAARRRRMFVANHDG